jgi:hypothetical protein
VTGRTARGIIGAAVGTLWAATVAAALVETSLRIYLTIWLATFVASVAAIMCVLMDRAAKRQERRDAALRDVLHREVCDLKATTREHAATLTASNKKHTDAMLAGTKRYIDYLRDTAFDAGVWFSKGITAGQIAEADAEEMAREMAWETAPLRIINGAQNG